MSFGSSTDPAPENDPQSHSANGAGVSAAQENTSTSAMAVGAATAGAKPDMPAQVQEVLASDVR